MTQNTITLKLTNEQETMLYTTYKENESKTPPYAKWQLKVENCTITCYASGKTVFQGKDAGIYASPFMQQENNIPEAGSDEVGTGDYFGPVVVAAAIIDEHTIEKAKELNTRDSKALSDADIRKIAPSLIRLLPHTILILSPEKYNKVHETNNINAIKAKMHNQAYINLAHKYGLPSFCMVDQFTPEASYYRYLKREKEVIRNLHFETKAEDHYLSVGAASIIARYAFLVEWDKMEEQYGMTLHKGAGKPADNSARAFVERYGFDKLKEVAKLHFRNTEKLL